MVTVQPYQRIKGQSPLPPGGGRGEIHSRFLILDSGHNQGLNAYVP